MRIELAQQVAQSVLSMLAREEKDGARLDGASRLCDLADEVTQHVKRVRELEHKRSPVYGALVLNSPRESLHETDLSMQSKLVESVHQLLQGVENLTHERIEQMEQLGQTSLRRSEDRVRKLRCETEKLRQDLLAASTALSAASATIADKQSKLTEVNLWLVLRGELMWVP